MSVNVVETPVPHELVVQKMAALGIKDMGQASIREIARLSRELEEESGVAFVHMEMGVPGLEPSAIGVDAEISALKKGVAQRYPAVEGIPELKKELSRFVKNFIDVEVSPAGCIPSVGSMQGGMAAFLMVNRCHEERDRVLFIDPGFPVQKSQLRVLGMPYETFDVYDFRGTALRAKLESYLKRGNISSILYSNPNNPSWVCLTEEELQIIGDLANEYDVTVIEDLAYFAMDFRKDLSMPGEPPYQATVARYTDNWLMLISASKAFSYAGQRIGSIIVSNKLFERSYPNLERYFPSPIFGRALIYGTMYALSSGVTASTQHAFAALLKAANDGKFDFVASVREYGRRAKIMKELFLKYGFELVYDMDGEQPLADGFYFTIRYPGLEGGELLEELLHYGISAISLGATGSERTEGLRACVSHVYPSQFDMLERRLKAFQANHKQGS